jgi:predicted transcriptional regulator
MKKQRKEIQITKKTFDQIAQNLMGKLTDVEMYFAPKSFEDMSKMLLDNSYVLKTDNKYRLTASGQVLLELSGVEV